MKKFIALFLGFIIIGCSNDDDIVDTITEPIVENQLVLKEIMKDGVLSISHEYFDDGKIKKSTYYNNDGTSISFFLDFEHLADTSSYKLYLGLNLDFRGTTQLYNIPDNQLSRNSYDEDGALKNYRIYQFFDEECSYNRADSYDENDTLISYFTVQLLDDNCSSFISTFDSNGILTRTDEYIRDNGNRYDISSSLNHFRSNNMGNIIQYTRKDENGEVDTGLSYEVTYEYNSDNYPTSSTRIYPDGTEYIYTYIYH